MRDSVTGVLSWRRPHVRSIIRASLGGVIAALALAAWTLPFSTARAARLDASGVSIEIQNPQPNGGVAEGPVGVNILAQGAIPSGGTVTIGYAASGTGCQTGMQPLPGASPDIQANGNFTVDFPWPTAVHTVNAEYYLCAEDPASSTIGQSTTLFRVDNASPPTITIQAVGDPNAQPPDPNTPTAAPTATAPSGQGYIGGFVQISGKNFTPGGQSLLFFATAGPFTPSAYSPGDAMTIASGNSRADNTGAFTVTVQLPTGETGNVVVSAVSQDGSTTTLPTLVASQTISLSPPPATPTPQPTATVKATATPSTGTAPKRAVGPIRITGLIGLGVLSIILFIIGVGFLVSASSLPRP